MNKVPYRRLSAVYFFYLAILGGFVPYWNLYLQTQLDFTPALIGQLMAITLVSRLLAPVFWGRIADRDGRHLTLARFGSLALTLLWVCISFAKGWWTLALMLLASSFFQNAILAQFEAVTVAHLGARRECYGRIRRWGSLGFMAMVAGLGVLFDAISLRWLPLIIAACALLTWIATMGVPDVAAMRRTEPGASLLRILRRPAVCGFLVASFLLQMAIAPYYTFYSIFLESHGYSRSAIGALWALGIAAEVLAFTWMHRLLPAFGERRVLLVALALAALRLAGIGEGVDNTHMLVLMQLLQAASFAAFHSACISLVARHFGEGHQGQGQAVYGMTWALGTAAGACLAGTWWDELGGATIFTAAALVALCGFLVARVTVRDADAQPAPGVPAT